ncbi:MAG: hypothetical protein E7Z92_00600 [Cyanobacteria bacterium SIG31]|nr:hypothetical protein [Cyanobacteria bacterium SIG31]
MNTVRIRNYIADEALVKLPSQYKSAKGRQAFAQILSNSLQEKVLNVPEDKLTIPTLKKLILEVLKPVLATKDEPVLKISSTPDNILYQGILKPIEKILDFNGQKFNTVLGYKMEIPTEDGIIKNPKVFIHEARHLFDRMCNPKYSVNRFASLDDNSEENIAFSNFIPFLANVTTFSEFNPFMDLKFMMYELVTKLALKCLNREEKMAALQRTRYKLQTEINAYNDMEKFEQSVSGKKKFALDNNSDVEYLKLEEKLEFINDLLAKTIEKERQKQAMSAWF